MEQLLLFYMGSGRGLELFYLLHHFLKESFVRDAEVVHTRLAEERLVSKDFGVVQFRVGLARLLVTAVRVAGSFGVQRRVEMRAFARQVAGLLALGLRTVQQGSVWVLFRQSSGLARRGSLRFLCLRRRGSSLHLKVISGQYLSAFNLVTADGYLEPLDRVELPRLEHPDRPHPALEEQEAVATFALELEGLDLVELYEVVVEIDYVRPAYTRSACS